MASASPKALAKGNGRVLSFLIVASILSFPTGKVVGSAISRSEDTVFCRHTMAQQIGMVLSERKEHEVAAPARDGDIAIREEFELLKKQGTRDAMLLFIRRHPHHPLVMEARKILQQMETRKPKAGTQEGK